MKIDISRIRKELARTKKKKPTLFSAVTKKIQQIADMDAEAIEHFKNLRHDTSDFRRVQVGSFILFFRLEYDTVVFYRFKHHDDAYRR